MAGAREQYPGVEVQTRRVGSDRMRALLEATRDAALVVVGSGSHSHRIGPRPGPLAAFQLHHSHCPVAVV
ncbi:universal stress protein [Streptomyces sp. NBC_01176]|uniref:universal stress protein n=1 Tax=Streptomyces sp. NBC_01176 TaxID=2903760 RepID=UPI00386C630D